jgi:hypothetical protein
VIPGAAGQAKLRPEKPSQAAVLVWAVRSPYVIVDSLLTGTFRVGKGDSVKVSVALADWRQRDFTLDQVWPAKPSWTTVWENKGEGAQAMKLDHAGLALRGEYQYLVKVEMMAATDGKTVGIKSLSFAHQVQQSQVALPRLLPGKNVITVTAEQVRPGYQLKVEYGWDDAKQKNRQHTQLIDRFPYRYEIDAAGDKAADVRTRYVILQAVKK